jgi:enterochelin esterase family protein
MKPAFWPFFLVVSCALFDAAAADAPAAVRTNQPPRRMGPPPVVSPEIGADRMVTFRLLAPGAREVGVSGQWAPGSTALTRGTNDVWSATVGPIDAGVYEYSLSVDGVGMIDPGNPAIKPMRQPRTSILQIAGNPPRLWDFQDVPHGTVHQHSYLAKSLNHPRELCVYTPPGYEGKSTRRYPLLVLQHGSGDNQATWVAHGRAHWILDNLIAQRRARPMIVLMLDGHGAALSADPDTRRNGTRVFEQELLQDALPLVEARYRVASGASHRAIAGLSMGGGQSLAVGLNHTDRFGWVAAFSAAPPEAGAIQTALADAKATNARLKLLWIACGKKDFLLKRNEDFVALLQGNSIRHQWRLTEGDHSWPVWRDYLAELAPLLFVP